MVPPTEDGTENATAADDGHLVKPERPPEEEVSLLPIPNPVLELLKGPIARRDRAMARWEKKLSAAAEISGVPLGADFELSADAEGNVCFAFAHNQKERS